MNAQHQPSFPRSTVLVGLICVTVLSGCIASNERPDIGRGIDLPSLSESAARPEGKVNDGPSLTGLARYNWKPTVLESPVYGIATKPVYTSEVDFTDETHRQKDGQHPNASTALELYGDTFWSQRAEAAASPFVFAYDLVLMPYRMVMQPPWKDVSHTQLPYQRGDFTKQRTAKVPRASVQAPPQAETETETETEQEPATEKAPTVQEPPVTAPEGSAQ